MATYGHKQVSGMRFSPFWSVTQSRLVVGYGRFVTTYPSHLEGSWRRHRLVWVMPFFHHDGDEVSTVLRNYAAHSGNYRRFGTTYPSHLEGSWRWHRLVRVMPFFHHEGDEVSTVLRNYAARSGNYLPTFRDNLKVPEERRYRTDRLSRNVSSYQSTL